MGCEDRSRSIGFEIKTGKSGVEELTAAIAEETSTIGSLEAKVEELAAGISTDEADIKAALKVLNEYYAKEDKSHDAADGAGSGIISLLEVCEADFSKNLAQVTTDEEMAVAEYEKETKENEIEKTTKSQDVKYKAKE